MKESANWRVICAVNEALPTTLSRALYTRYKRLPRTRVERRVYSPVDKTVAGQVTALTNKKVLSL